MNRFARVFCIAVCAALVSIAVSRPPARAGTLPDISGTWYGNGYASRRCQIRQSGTSVSLTNEQGSTATGTFTDPGTLSTNWGGFGSRTVTGRISGDLRTITWSNGTYWTRSPQSVPDVPSATPTPKPYFELERSRSDEPHAPIDLLAAWAAVMRDGSAAHACVSFKNAADTAAQQVHFEIQLLDRDRNVVDTAYLDRSGTFSPNVGIHGYGSFSDWGQGNRGYRDNCTVLRPNGRQERRDYARLRYFSVRVTRVRYADGTSWPSQ